MTMQRIRRDDDVFHMMRECSEDVLTSLGVQVSPGENKPSRNDYDLCAVVSLTAENLSATLVIASNNELLELVNDCSAPIDFVGEMANLIGGRLKNVLYERGLDGLAITLPITMSAGLMPPVEGDHGEPAPVFFAAQDSGNLAVWLAGTFDPEVFQNAQRSDDESCAEPGTFTFF